MEDSTKADSNNVSQAQTNQLQPINDLSRFGHSVTLCKVIFKIIHYYYSKFE